MDQERSTRTVPGAEPGSKARSEEHTSELQSPCNIVCRLLLEKNKQANAIASPAFLRPLVVNWKIGPQPPGAMITGFPSIVTSAPVRTSMAGASPSEPPPSPM